MKKKGFTLVELLAVIAILAILVIVAMPNVLGTFNKAKADSFANEVKTYLDIAKQTYVANALTSGGQQTFCTEEAEGYGTCSDKKELSVDGSPKNYYIAVDSQGRITEIIIWDTNFCYSKTGTEIVKNDVTVGDVKLEPATVSAEGETPKTIACGENKAIAE